MWVKQVEDKRLPEWLGSHLFENCSICGSPMENYYNEDDGRCTNRRCSNPTCPGMIAARADNMRQLLGLKGLGYASCLDTVRLHDIKYPIEILKYWGIKPKVTIGKYLRMQCWPGVDSGLETEMQKHAITSLNSLFERYDGKYKDLILSHKDELLRFQDLVTLPEEVTDRPDRIYTIMITGTPNGFNTKDHFINSVNRMCSGKIVTIHQATKRQSGVDFLIREPGSTTRGKVEAAQRGGIPIVTSEEYMGFLMNQLSEILEYPIEEIVNRIQEQGHI